MKAPKADAVTYESVSEKLIDAVPELRAVHTEELAWWGSDVPGPYIIFEDIFRPHLDQLIDTAEFSALRRAFDFIELCQKTKDSRWKTLCRSRSCNHSRSTGRDYFARVHTWEGRRYGTSARLSKRNASRAYLQAPAHSPTARILTGKAGPTAKRSHRPQGRSLLSRQHPPQAAAIPGHLEIAATGHLGATAGPADIDQPFPVRNARACGR